MYKYSFTNVVKVLWWYCGRVFYRALVHFVHFVHFVHLLWVLSAFTLTEPAEFSALKVPGWRTNGKKMKCKTMDTTRTKRAPSWLRSGRGGALLAAFHKKSTFILAEVTDANLLATPANLRSQDGARLVRVVTIVFHFIFFPLLVCHPGTFSALKSAGSDSVNALSTQSKCTKCTSAR